MTGSQFYQVFRCVGLVKNNPTRYILYLVWYLLLLIKIISAVKYEVFSSVEILDLRTL